MKVEVALGGDRGHLGNRVDHAQDETRRRADEQDSVVSDRGPIGVEVHLPGVTVQRCRHDLQAKVVRGFPECRVRRLRQHHLWLGHLRTPDPSPVAGRFDRQQNALRAARGDIAEWSLGVHQIRRHRDHLALEAIEAGEQARVQGIAGEEPGVCLQCYLEHVVTRRIGDAGREPFLPAGVTLAGLGQLRAQLVGRQTGGRKRELLSRRDGHTNSSLRLLIQRGSQNPSSLT